MKTILAAAVFALAAFAQMGTIDQQYSGPFELGDLCCENIGLNNLAVGQSFIPTRDYLTGISVHLNNGAVAAKRVHLILRAGSITGAIVPTSTSIMPVPGQTHGWINFDFCPVRVVPNSLYVIQLVTENGANDVGWSLRNGNPYVHGSGYRDSQVVPWDYGFRTYYMLPATNAFGTVIALNVPANVTRGVAFPSTISYQLITVPQGAFVSAFATANIANVYTAHTDWCKLTPGIRNLTFSLTAPAGLAVGARDVTAQFGIRGFNVSTLVRQVNVQ